MFLERFEASTRSWLLCPTAAKRLPLKAWFGIHPESLANFDCSTLEPQTFRKERLCVAAARLGHEARTTWGSACVAIIERRTQFVNPFPGVLKVGITLRPVFKLLFSCSANLLLVSWPSCCQFSTCTAVLSSIHGPLVDGSYHCCRSTVRSF